MRRTPGAQRAITRDALQAGWTIRRDALHAEWTKLRTSPGTIWLLLAVITLTAAVSLAATATVSCPVGGCTVDPTKVSLTGVTIGQAVVAILAVLAISGEYGTGMIHTSLTAVPRRTVVLAAKAAVLMGLVVPAASIAVLASLLAGRPILADHGYQQPPLTDGSVLRAAAGSVLYLALIALLSLGAASAVRDSAAATAIVLGLLYVFPIIVQAVSDPDWRRHLQQVGPMSAGLAIQATTDLSSLPISPWAGLGVLAAWSVAALLIGGLVLQSRDA